MVLWLRGEQREVPALARRLARLITGHVCGHDKQPAPWVLGTVRQRARERLLREVLRPFGVPYLAVQEAHQGGVGGAINVREIVRHRRSGARVAQPTNRSCETPRETPAGPAVAHYPAAHWLAPASRMSMSAPDSSRRPRLASLMVR